MENNKYLCYNYVITFNEIMEIEYFVYTEETFLKSPIPIDITSLLTQFNPQTPKISLVILLTACQMILNMLA